MDDNLKYPGKELEIFDKAILWRKYLFKKIKKYIGKEILEVGAGMGSFTKNYFQNDQKIVLSELDANLLEILNDRFKKFSNIQIKSKYTKNIENQFDSILYISVLEHIEDDIREIKTALDKLKNGGRVIICVPAHNYMYSKFDKEIGHFRRYEINFFKKLKFHNANVEKCFMIDSMGWIIYFLNKIFFKKEDYPSKLKVMIWDKFFVPLSIILDFITFYKFGKNILCIIRKN